jgi:hypothetical protein
MEIQNFMIDTNYLKIKPTKNNHEKEPKKLKQK